MNLINESKLFSKENIERIENVRNAKYVCDTENKDIHVAVFYGDTPHPESGSRYFALYQVSNGPRPEQRQLMITNGAFVEEQKITGVVADNGDVIYSSFRHDYNTSPDGSVFVDGGRAYTRSNTQNQVTLVVRDGVMRILENV